MQPVIRQQKSAYLVLDRLSSKRSPMAEAVANTPKLETRLLLLKELNRNRSGTPPVAQAVNRPYNPDNLQPSNGLQPPDLRGLRQEIATGIWTFHSNPYFLHKAKRTL
jgi:hypothetical protein